jgi:hypothetical protein
MDKQDFAEIINLISNIQENTDDYKIIANQVLDLVKEFYPEIDRFMSGTLIYACDVKAAMYKRFLRHHNLSPEIALALTINTCDNFKNMQNKVELIHK